MVNILTINLAISTFLFWLVSRLYLMPRLSPVTAKAIIVPILLLHMSRHLGLMFLSPGAVYPGLPQQFAYPAALGDFIAAVLAAISLLLILKRLPGQRGMVWIFSLWGVADLAVAITLATAYNAEPFMGAAYWIPAFWVPGLLVTHYITFVILVKHWGPEHSR
ncbi:MAG: hypothetical protein K5872_05805 [Rhizobiaceae bacterium]|nr:hypothetical protein [Rhizobiaceae bacterium]MCV0405726.1 hypothetical protein [Rhizobiaceae bacterium]